MAGGRRWFEAFLLFMCIGSGIRGLAGGSSDRALEASFPAWGQYLWYGGLLLGGFTALVGALMFCYVGLLIERAGMFLLSGVCAAYTVGAVALCLVADGGSAYATTLVFIFGVLCQQRAWQARREVSAYQREVQRLAALRTLAPRTEAG